MYIYKTFIHNILTYSILKVALTSATSRVSLIETQQKESSNDDIVTILM